MRIRWTSTALNDFKAISYHIERQRNLATANRVCRHIYDAIQILRGYPHTAERCDTRRAVRHRQSGATRVDPARRRGRGNS